MSKVILLGSDLAVASRVRSAAERAGLSFGDAESAEACTAKISAGERALVLVDLGLGGLNVAAAVQTLRQAPGGSVQIMAFGPHVHEALLSAARDANCDRVMSRGQLHGQLDAVLAEFARG
jgi:CheY-like chemotaxis protein